ncbi:MAG: lamin tail domain-containing protein [Bacteroidota bacterium]
MKHFYAFLLSVAWLLPTTLWAQSAGDVIVTEIMYDPSAVSDANGEFFELYNTTGATIDIDGWVISDLGTESHIINNSGALNIPAGGYLILGRNIDIGTNGGVSVDYEFGGFTLNNIDDEIILTAGVTEIDRVEYDETGTFPTGAGRSIEIYDLSVDNNDGTNWGPSISPLIGVDYHTAGQENSLSVARTAIVINEFLVNPDVITDANGEWIELLNNSTIPLDIEDWTLSDDGTNTHDISTSLVIEPGAFAVLGRNNDQSVNGGVGVDYQYGSFQLDNGGDEIVLQMPAPIPSSEEVDRVAYDGGTNFPSNAGRALELFDASANNAIGTNWEEGSMLLDNNNYGTPGAPNSTTRAAAGGIVINEIMKNPDVVSDTDGEWFELKGTFNTRINLNGWTIADDGSNSHTINTDLWLEVGAYLILGRNGDIVANGGVSVDYDYADNWALTNTTDEVRLLGRNDNEIDEVNYDGTFPNPAGASIELNSVLNDNNVAGNWAAATDPYSADNNGTPGAQNSTFVNLPVVLTSFFAELNLNDEVELSWETSQEINNDYFRIEKRQANGSFLPIAQVAGAGTVFEPVAYSFLDRQTILGANQYRLIQIDLDGQEEDLGMVEVFRRGDQFVLEVFPNPVVDELTLRYLAPEASLTGAIYSLQGQLVQEFFLPQAEAGEQKLDLSKLPSGIYLLKVKGLSGTEVHRLQLR